jgi:hypothetical protein
MKPDEIENLIDLLDYANDHLSHARNGADQPLTCLRSLLRARLRINQAIRELTLSS